MENRLSLSRIQCPQFYDFTEIDQTKEGADLGFSPVLEIASPVLNVQRRGLWKKKAVPANKKPVPARTPVNHVPNLSDSEKRALSQVKLPRRLSKSDGSINLLTRNMKPSANDASYSFSVQHNRSVSENDLGPKTKKFPTTPMCLKRTLNKAKIKKFKTSEELELEKIAELQKQMHQHLRANEIAMRRLQRKMNVSAVQRDWSKTDSKKENVKVDIRKDHNNLEKLNNFRQCSSVSNQEKIDLKAVFPSKQRTKNGMNCLREVQKNATKGLSENKDPKSEVDGVLMKNWQPKPYLAHTGLAFMGNKKFMAIKPFNFNCRVQESSLKDQIKVQVPRTGHKLTGKENNAWQNSFTDVKKARTPVWRTPFHASKGKDLNKM